MKTIFCDTPENFIFLADDRNPRKRHISPKKSTFEDFKPTVLESRTRRQAQGEHFEGSNDDDDDDNSGKRLDLLTRIWLV